MRTFLILLFLLLFAREITAQTKSARMDIEYLRNIAMPDYDKKMRGIQRYRDSLIRKITDRKDVGKWINHVESAKEIKEARDETEQEQLDMAEIAKKKLDSMTRRFNEMITTKESYIIEKNKEMNDIINKYLIDNSYNVAFIYTKDGLDNIFYPDSESKRNIQFLLVECRAIKLKDFMDGKKLSTVSQAEVNAASNKALEKCMNKILEPYIKDSLDITKQIEQLLKN